MQIHKQEFKTVWPQVKRLLEEKFSIIPVRDKQEGDHKPKTPYSYWTKYQTEIITEADLWHLMATKYNTTAIAVVGGAVSGNLEIIDIDNKNKAGIEAEVFNAINTLFPNLFKRLRIHKSPSGGYHILYRVSDGKIPGNKQLAKLPLEPGQKQPKAFLETRGEGGYVLLPPSMGYEIYQDVPVPVITWTERCAIISICEGFTEFIKVDEEKVERKADDYYDVNPFQHFNKSPEAEGVLEANGWPKYGSNAKFIWFSRPGGSKTIHAALLKGSNLYYFFTTNTEFTNDKCYQPATVLSILEHGGDKKKTYRELVQRGYGIIKPNVEKAIIARAEGTPPPNLSLDARAAFTAAISERERLYPYGAFWTVESDESITIDRENLYKVANGLGFRFDYGTQTIVRIKENRVYKSHDRDFFDTVKNYIKDEQILSAYEAFLQRSGKFSIGRLQLLNEDEILNDTRHVCYKFFKDVIVKITKDEWTEHGYNELGPKQLIWADQIQKREFRFGDSGRYVDFLEKALEYDKREKYIQSIIGYLAHNFKSEDIAYMPVLIEQCEDPIHGGGSGKNVFCNLFKLTTTVSGKPGEQITYDNNLLQAWSGERIFVMSDVPKNFKFSFFKELIAGPGSVNKKYVNEVVVPIEKMPKFVVQTNYSYENVDGGMKRRLRPLEFTDFFTKAQGLDVHYGINFPWGWNEEDWAGYDGTIIMSVQHWLKSHKIDDLVLTEGSWRKKFQMEYNMTTYEFIKENFQDWVEMEEVKNDVFKKQLDDFYIERNVSRIYQYSSIRINKAIAEYSEHYGYGYIPDVKKREMGLQYKCRVWIKKENIPPF